MPNPSQQVTEELRRQITAGQYPIGSFLPSGRALAQRFGVARETVAAGVRSLVDEGLVESHPKRGYQVLAVATQLELEWSRDGRVLLAGQIGLGPGEDLRVEVRRASAEVAGLLQGPPEMSVVVRSTVHRHAGSPWALREFTVPRSVADVARRLGEAELLDEAATLADHGLAESGHRSTWTARSAAAEESQVLKSGASPVHVLQRVAFHGPDPVSCEVVVMRADRIFMSRMSGSAKLDPEQPEV